MKLPDGRFRKIRELGDVPGDAHELTFSCFRRLRLLSKDQTREWFIAALAAARKRHQFQLWAYVIMPEHAHVLVFPTRPIYSTAAIRTAIKQPVSRQAIAWLRKRRPDWLPRLQFRWRNGDSGYHFWQPGGGYDRNIVCNSTAHNAIDYIHHNPVRRGLVTTPTDWPWSSARWYAGDTGCMLEMDATPDWQLQQETTAKRQSQRCCDSLAVPPDHALPPDLPNHQIAKSIDPNQFPRDYVPVHRETPPMRILITAGPTREHIDPVRFICNTSTGRMGYAIANAAAARDHAVVLITGPVELPPPASPIIETIPVVSAADMLQAANDNFSTCDAAILTAAVCDFRPAVTASLKIPKQDHGLSLQLEPTADIAASLAESKRDRIVVGFAMEDHDPHERAKAKLQKKRFDAIVLNGVQAAGADWAQVQILREDTGWQPPVSGTKSQLAGLIVELVEALVGAGLRAR